MLIRQYLATGKKHALIKKYALNKYVRLLTRLYGSSNGACGKRLSIYTSMPAHQSCRDGVQTN